MGADHRTRLRTGLNEKMGVNTSGMQHLINELLLLLFLPSLVVNSSGTETGLVPVCFPGVLPSKGHFPDLVLSNCLPVAASDS